VLAAELQTGEWVAVEFQLPTAGSSLQTKAVVRHYNQLRCGFEFLGLSRDQRYMIRQWAGTIQPEQSALGSSIESQLESPIVGSYFQKLPAAVAIATPVLAQRSNARLRIRISPSARRLLWVTVALLSTVAVVSYWQWREGWARLEAQTTRKDAHARPVSGRVPPEIVERLLIRKVDPIYPDSARRGNIQGVVVLDATIAADGAVVNLSPISGPPALIAAAMDAARWWRFRPYRVQGEPAPVQTSLAIDVHP
jgi:TonB family protein